MKGRGLRLKAPTKARCLLLMTVEQKGTGLVQSAFVSCETDYGTRNYPLSGSALGEPEGLGSLSSSVDPVWSHGDEHELPTFCSLFLCG